MLTAPACLTKDIGVGSFLSAEKVHWDRGLGLLSFPCVIIRAETEL